MQAKYKPLKWVDDPPREFDGKSVGSWATEAIGVDGQTVVHARYDVRRGATRATEDEWFVLIQYNHDVKGTFRVGGLEEGKFLCAHYREQFWDNLLDSLSKYILEGE